MNPITIVDARYIDKRKQTDKELFLSELNRVVRLNGLITKTELCCSKIESSHLVCQLILRLPVHVKQN